MKPMESAVDFQSKDIKLVKESNTDSDSLF